jgi:hypothetical protein
MTGRGSTGYSFFKRAKNKFLMSAKSLKLPGIEPTVTNKD